MTMRAVGSSHSDPYSSLAAAVAALYAAIGPLMGANEIGATDAVGDRLEGRDPRYIRRVKGRRVPSDGLRAPHLQELDPRAEIIKKWPTTSSR
jgi:citrate synthase